jgi:hypothetical protein
LGIDRASHVQSQGLLGLRNGVLSQKWAQNRVAELQRIAHKEIAGHGLF